MSRTLVNRRLGYFLNWNKGFELSGRTQFVGIRAIEPQTGILRARHASACASLMPGLQAVSTLNNKMAE